jgi:hypothetical protein
MVNGLGVLGWGVGGIEAVAAGGREADASAAEEQLKKFCAQFGRAGGR